MIVPTSRTCNIPCRRSGNKSASAGRGVPFTRACHWGLSLCMYGVRMYVCSRIRDSAADCVPWRRTRQYVVIVGRYSARPPTSKELEHVSRHIHTYYYVFAQCGLRASGHRQRFATPHGRNKQCGHYRHIPYILTYIHIRGRAVCRRRRHRRRRGGRTLTGPPTLTNARVRGNASGRRCRFFFVYLHTYPHIILRQPRATDEDRPAPMGRSGCLPLPAERGSGRMPSGDAAVLDRDAPPAHVSGGR